MGKVLMFFCVVLDLGCDVKVCILEWLNELDWICLGLFLFLVRKV